MKTKCNFLMIAFGLVVCSASFVVSQAAPDESMTTTIIEERETTAQEAAALKKQDAALRKQLANAKSYCRKVDANLKNNAGNIRLFVLIEKDVKVAKWRETKKRSDFKLAKSGATVRTLSGKPVVADCFFRDVANVAPNEIKFYFYPNGALAHTRITIRAFRSPVHLNGKAIVTQTAFFDKNEKAIYSPFVPDNSQNFLNAKTLKKRAPFIFSAYVGFDSVINSRVEHLPFYELLKSSTSKQ